MLNRSASLAMSTSVLKALPGKLGIKRHSPRIFYVQRVRKLELYCTLTMQAWLKVNMHFNNRYLELFNACILKKKKKQHSNNVRNRIKYIISFIVFEYMYFI